MSLLMSSGPGEAESELWLFLESPVPAAGGEVDLRMVAVEDDAAVVVRPMSVHKSSLRLAWEVEPWTKTAVVTLPHEGMVAVGVRLSGRGVAQLDGCVNWTVTFEGHSRPMTATAAFATSRSADEGLVRTPLMSDSEAIGELQLRFLLIRDTLADVLPGASTSSWLHQLREGDVLLAGHRGLGVDPASEPENSLAAFNAAYAVGADMVELDVQLTKDGRQVIFHDLFLPGAREDSKELIRDLDWSEVEKRIPNVTDLPTVFANVHPDLGIDVEVKYPNLQVNGRLESGDDASTMMTPDGDGTGITRAWSKDRLATSVLGTVTSEARRRRLLLSTFNPDLALVFSRKLSPSLRSQVPVVLLTRGERHSMAGKPQAHADSRSRTVHSGVSWARAAGLDGVAAFTASVLAQDVPSSSFDRERLPALLWGDKLNDVETLRRLKQEGWASVLIFDHIDALLPDVRR